MVRSLSDNNYSNHTMTLTGQGYVTAAPDTAVIRLGVRTTGYNVSQIQSDNAQSMKEVIQALNLLGITEIKTVQYLIDQLYEYQEGKQIDKGYEVKHIVQIQTDKLNEVGKIIDTVVSAGSNLIEAISFELSEPALFYQQALNNALNNAVDKAKSISDTLHTRLNPVPIRILENSIPPVPFLFTPRGAATTPIIPGGLSVEAFVTVDFAYTD
ncbi:SIMPL domain-containing protein [Aminipila luticellarii]|uniref:DUF541 domain-containing protein n=1 Tax=Aminipila luticellarii TaxID=2507160 RepID=A0A410PTM0_9FIRM|nr:SIMPL domain-containing protein [Aminipila luticellarii]QAT42236.1 DUF541 domain-containing protein [Aminipila luticellarii]